MNPISKFPIVKTNRVEEAEYRLTDSITKLQILSIDDRQNFQLEMNGFNFGKTSLLYNRFKTETKLKTRTDIECVVFIVGSKIPSLFYVDDQPYLISPQNAAIVAPAKQVRIERPKNSELLFLKVPMSELWNHFEMLTNRHHKGSLIFDRDVNLISGPGSSLKRLMNYLVHELNSNDSILKIPGLKKKFDEMILTTMLSLPNNKKELIYEDYTSNVIPAVVKKSEEYMRANLSQSISVSDLLQISGCSRTVLFSAFRKFRGYTPMEFLTEQRLWLARRQILKSDYNTSITSIALDSGFISGSWFSQIYRKRFGERPSDTFRNRRLISG